MFFLRMLLFSLLLLELAQANTVTIKNSGNHAVNVGFFKNLGDYQPSFSAERTILVNGREGSQTVTLDHGWEGRVQKVTGAPADPATWVEFRFNAWQDMTFGDVSLIRGYNGATRLTSKDGSLNRGFSKDLYSGAPQQYKVHDSKGTAVLAATETWTGSRHEELVSYYRQHLARDQAYIINSDHEASQGTNSKDLIIEFF